MLKRLAKQQGHQIDDNPWPTPKGIKANDFDLQRHRQGWWTEEEHRSFEEAIMIYGQDAEKI